MESVLSDQKDPAKEVPQEEPSKEILDKRRTRVVFPNVYAARVWMAIASAAVTWILWVSKEVTKVSVLQCHTIETTKVEEIKK